MARAQAGFTLIEAVVTVAIAGIVLTIGLPSFQSTLQAIRTQTTLNALGTDFAMARGSAVMRRADVIVCPRAAGNRCADNNTWTQGWLVVADPDGNRQPDAPTDVLRATDNPAAADQRLRLASTRGLLRYQADGRSAGTNLTVRLCAGASELGEVVVNNVGRTRSARPAPGTPCPGA